MEKPVGNSAKKGWPSVSLHGEAGSPEFMKSYAGALKGIQEPQVNTRIKARSMSDLIHKYRQSHAYIKLADSSKRSTTLILKDISKKYGLLAVNGITRKHIVLIHQSKAETPNAANHYLQKLKLLLDLAVDLEWLRTNHARTVSQFRAQSDGHHSWTDEEIAQYMDYYKNGTRERLAICLYLFTAQRGSDVATMGWHSVKDGSIRIRQVKTGKWLWIPIHPILNTELQHWRSNMVFVLNAHGAPFSVKGFQQWFAKSARTAGLDNCTGHGLRKAASRMLAEFGASSKQIMAVTGLQTSSEADRYTRAADQKRLAKSAIQLFEPPKSV